MVQREWVEKDFYKVLGVSETATALAAAAADSACSGERTHQRLGRCVVEWARQMASAHQGNGCRVLPQCEQRVDLRRLQFVVHPACVERQTICNVADDVTPGGTAPQAQ